MNLNRINNKIYNKRVYKSNNKINRTKKSLKLKWASKNNQKDSNCIHKMNYNHLTVPDNHWQINKQALQYQLQLGSKVHGLSMYTCNNKTLMAVLCLICY